MDSYGSVLVPVPTTSGGRWGDEGSEGLAPQVSVKYLPHHMRSTSCSQSPAQPSAIRLPLSDAAAGDRVGTQ